jgi:hypothetical protein
MAFQAETLGGGMSDGFPKRMPVFEGALCFLLFSFLVAGCSSSPTSPLEIGQLSLGAAYDVFVEGETAYVSNNEGIAILDIADIENPKRVGKVQEASAGWVLGFHLSGDSLFTFGDQLAAYDISDSEHPSLLFSFPGRDGIAGAQRTGDYLFLAYLQGGFEVFDLSNPQGPTSVAYLGFSGQVNDLAAVGDMAYVANSHTGLAVIDISDPTAPESLGSVNGTPGAWDISLAGNRLFLGCHMHGVRVLDLSDPSEPTVLGSFDNGGETYGVHVVGTRLYTVDLQEGVEVLDVSSPGSPTLIMRDGSYHPHDLYSDGRYLFLADQDKHFVILPLELGAVT